MRSSRGAAFGLLLFVPLSAIRVVIDQNVSDFDHSGWAPVFAIALFVVYIVAGLVAARAAVDAPLSNGIVAAVGAFLLWIPIRIVIWLIRDNGDGLFSGSAPVFTPRASSARSSSRPRSAHSADGSPPAAAATAAPSTPDPFATASASSHGLPPAFSHRLRNPGRAFRASNAPSGIEDHRNVR